MRVCVCVCVCVALHQIGRAGAGGKLVEAKVLAGVEAINACAALRDDAFLRRGVSGLLDSIAGTHWVTTG